MKCRKILAGTLTIAAILAMMPAQAVLAENNELVLYTWEGMFPQEVLDGFTEETARKTIASAVA